MAIYGAPNVLRSLRGGGAIGSRGSIARKIVSSSKLEFEPFLLK